MFLRLGIRILSFIAFLSATNADLLCSYGKFCRTSADCVGGNICSFSSTYYSRCVPDGEFAKLQNCIPDSNQCGGCYEV